MTDKQPPYLRVAYMRAQANEVAQATEIEALRERVRESEDLNSRALAYLKSTYGISQDIRAYFARQALSTPDGDGSAAEGGL